MIKYLALFIFISLAVACGTSSEEQTTNPASNERIETPPPSPMEQVLLAGEGTIVDVRTVEEFQSGHVESSVNIPLADLENRLTEVQAMNQPIILCCASGNRAGKAMTYLNEQGLKTYNAGGWQDVEAIIKSK